MKKKILLVQNLLLLSAALSLAIFTISCDCTSEETEIVYYAVGDDGGGGGGEFVEETLTFTVKGVDFVMKPVPGGTFWMGAQDDDPDSLNYDWDAWTNESPVHQVTLSDYYMGETEVTQELWQAVMGSNPSFFTGNLQRPVERVSWNDIVRDFLPTLNAATGRTFALPTEAQWEFAARGGNQSHGYKIAGGKINDVAWYDRNACDVGRNHPDYGTHVVKTKSPNELGLYDMSGNVAEWCKDLYDKSYYSSSPSSNPTGPPSSSDSYRVERGGAFCLPAWQCRVAFRDHYGQNGCLDLLGFRLVLLP